MLKPAKVSKNKMIINVWVLNAIVFLLGMANTLFWGYAVRNVGEPSFNFGFLLKLGFNPFFLLALLTALCSTLVSYSILSSLGIARGRFFVATTYIAVVVTSVIFLGEKLTVKEYLGVALILAGTILVAQ